MWETIQTITQKAKGLRTEFTGMCHIQMLVFAFCKQSCLHFVAEDLERKRECVLSFIVSHKPVSDIFMQYRYLMLPWETKIIF